MQKLKSLDLSSKDVASLPEISNLNEIDEIRGDLKSLGFFKSYQKLKAQRTDFRNALLVNTENRTDDELDEAVISYTVKTLGLEDKFKELAEDVKFEYKGDTVAIYYAPEGGDRELLSGYKVGEKMGSFNWPSSYSREATMELGFLRGASGHNQEFAVHDLDRVKTELTLQAQSEILWLSMDGDQLVDVSDLW